MRPLLFLFVLREEGASGGSINKFLTLRLAQELLLARGGDQVCWKRWGASARSCKNLDRRKRGLCYPTLAAKAETRQGWSNRFSGG